MTANKIQKILLVFLLVTTLVLATIMTIFFSRGGYITDNGVIVTNTGTLSIQTDPDNIKYTVYLDDKSQTVVDKKVQRITEGMYVVKIQADGFSEWSKRIQIRQGLVTEIYAKLYPSSTSLAQVTKTNIDKMFFSKDGTYIYYVVKNSEIGSDEGIWRLPINPSGLFFQQNQDPVKIAEISPEISAFIEAGTYRIIENNDNSKVVLENTALKKYFVFNSTEFNNSPYISLDQLTGFNLTKVSWLSTNSNILVSTSNILSDYNLNTGTSTLLKYQPDQPIIYGSNNSSVYIYTPSTKKLQIYQSQKLVDYNLKGLIIPDNITSIKLAPTNSDVIFLGTDKGVYYYVNLKKLFIKKTDDSTVAKALVIEDVSNDGGLAIFSDASNNLYTFTAKENVGLNTIETKFSEFANIKYKAGDFYISPQSNQIIFYDATAKSIKASEPDGSTIVTIVNNTDLLPYSNLNYKADYLFVLVNDGTATSPKNNIYKVKLDRVV